MESNQRSQKKWLFVKSSVVAESTLEAEDYCLRLNWVPDHPTRMFRCISVFPIVLGAGGMDKGAHSTE
jgi:hypothetical protein